MTDRDDRISIDEINKLIAQKDQEIDALMPKINLRKQAEETHFNKLQELLVSLNDCESKYYEFRTILGDALIELSELEKGTIESLMPIYEQKIEHFRKELQDFKIGEF